MCFLKFGIEVGVLESIVIEQLFVFKTLIVQIADKKHKQRKN
jgi:hypothetical protein